MITGARVKVDGMAPVVAVPTTAGTGSEVGRASVITDQAQHLKKIIFHPRMLPAQVILDPELTVGLPQMVTAATGWTPCPITLEALCSPFYHPMAEGIAAEGIRLVQEYLPKATADGTDIEARTQMLVCSSMGATAFQKGLGRHACPGTSPRSFVRCPSRHLECDSHALRFKGKSPGDRTTH